MQKLLKKYNVNHYSM